MCDSPVRIVEHINRARSVPRRDLVEIKTKDIRMTNDKTPTNATIDALYDRSVVDQFR